MGNWTRNEKMAYFFWIDNLVLTHWSEYLDLRLDEYPNDNEICENKLKLIDFYEVILDDVAKEFTWKELDEWYRKKYGHGTAFIRFCKDMFPF